VQDFKGYFDSIEQEKLMVACTAGRRRKPGSGSGIVCARSPTSVNYFRTGTCGRESHKMDDYVYMPLLRWLSRRGGQRKPRDVHRIADQFLGNGSVSFAWYRALPVASRISKIIVKPCAGKPRARFERGLLKTGGLL
jgi:hypothetical protein